VLDPNFAFVPVILGADNPQCQIAPVQKSVAKFTLVMNLIIGLLSAVIAPKLGHMSDRYGRKRWMGLASAGGIVAEVITILAAKYPETIDYRWILLGAVCDGLTGSFTAGSLLSQSYASDCSPPSKRGVAIGYLHACLFTGLALGPLLAAKLIKRTGSLISIFYVVLGCHVLFVLFLSFVIPESLSKRRQLAAREKHAKEREGKEHVHWLSSLLRRNPFAPLKILYPTGTAASSKLRRNLIAMAIVDAVVLGCAFGAATVIILYSGFTFKWDTADNASFVSTVSMVRAFVLLAIFPVLNYFLRILPARRRLAEGVPPPPEKNAGCDEVDIWLVRSALVSDVIGVTVYIFARTPALFYLGGIITAFGGLGGATVQAALTKHVPSEMVGQLLGAIGLLHALARVLAPMAFNGLYYVTVATFPQAIFVLLVSLFVVALLASFFVRPHGKSPSRGRGRACE
jgi:MFS family permease